LALPRLFLPSALPGATDHRAYGRGGESVLKQRGPGREGREIYGEEGMGVWKTPLEGRKWHIPELQFAE
jgi:hypothetical protein